MAKQISKEALAKLNVDICRQIQAFKDLGKTSKKTGAKLVGMLAGAIKVYPYLQETYDLTAQESYDVVAKLAMTGGFKIVRTHGYGGLFLLNSDVVPLAPKAPKADVDKYKAFR